MVRSYNRILIHNISIIIYIRCELSISFFRTRYDTICRCTIASCEYRMKERANRPGGCSIRMPSQVTAIFIHQNIFIIYIRLEQWFLLSNRQNILEKGYNYLRNGKK